MPDLEENGKIWNKKNTPKIKKNKWIFSLSKTKFHFFRTGIYFCTNLILSKTNVQIAGISFQD